MPSGIKAASVTRVTMLVALLVVTVLVASMLAYEAQDASRSQRVTVERALQDYATVAAWELQLAARKRVESAMQQALSPVVTGTASSPYETLLPLSIVSTTARTLLPCARDSLDSSRMYVRLDLRDGSVASSGALLTSRESERLAGAIRQHVRSRAAPEAPFGLMHIPGDSTRALAVGVKYSMFGAPLAAFGFTVCAGALGPAMAQMLLATHPLLPSAVRGEVPNDSLIAVRVTDRAGRALFVSGPVATPYEATVVLDSTLGMAATVAVREAAATRLLVQRPSRSRVPVLIALLALTAALAAVALLQLRREHELARLRADFTSSVSHELRTPLAQILLFGETLSLGRTRDDAERELAARTIVTEARRLMRMVENILVFDRSRRSPLSSGEAHADLVDVAREVVRGFEPLAATSGARIALEADCRSAWVRGDPSLVRQILLNLLDNAVKYGPRGQEVRVMVTCTPGAGEATLAVTDEGPGVPASERARIWEPYVRLRGVEGGRSVVERVGARGGSGLGLAVVRDLVTALGGRVWVEEVRRENGNGDGNRGGGARFVLTVPLAGGATGAIIAHGGRGAPPENQNTAHPTPGRHPSVAPPIQ